MKILSWNVAGIRACLKKGSLDFLTKAKWDIVCFQETKAEENEVNVPTNLSIRYPHRYWQSTQGITQRKGLSGTAIWCKKPARAHHPPPEFDVEGRTTTLEFHSWILVTVYTPNSQKVGGERNKFRVNEWDHAFRKYVEILQSRKPTIICGDFNVAYHNIDVEKPVEYRNVCPGFLDEERVNFHALIEAGWIDSFRTLHPERLEAYTYWDQRIPTKRLYNRGWRIDYFLVPTTMKNRIIAAEIHPTIMGSDHCPISLEFYLKRRLQIIDA